MYDIFAVSFSTFDNNYFKQIKEHYPSALLCENVKSFQEIKSKSFTKLFWIIWDDTELNSQFNLNEYRTTKWDDMYIHVFLNGEHRDGVCLFPKKIEVSDEEFKNRKFKNNKNIDIIASNPRKYQTFEIDTFDDYQTALNTVKYDMFWCKWKEIEITDENIFSTYFSYHNTHDRTQNHAYLHQFRTNEQNYNGLHLMSKHAPVSKREIDYRFLINKKEHTEVVSTHKHYDIVFISYNEPNADENYKQLASRFPRAKRIHGVKGIHQAHIEAAKIVDSDMFWVVDGDAEILENFDFSYVVNRYELDIVHVWRSINPINDLIYGYGGVKLLPKNLTLNMNTSVTDMTTSISSKFKAVQEISNITAFNTDEFNTWKSAFRECVKLSSKIIQGQKDNETEKRLEVWTTVGHEQRFGNTAIRGARHGSAFGSANRDNPDQLACINDFDWLKEQFEIQKKY